MILCDLITSTQTKQPLAATPEATVAEQPTEEPAAEEGKTKKKKDKVGIIWHCICRYCLGRLVIETAGFVLVSGGRGEDGRGWKLRSQYKGV